jgi:phospholipid transport system substrate-binding protein
MPLSRRSLLALAPAVLVASRAAADPGSAAVVIDHFYGVLLSVMKAAKGQSFDRRYASLAPAVSATFNLPMMTRIAVGPDWSQLTADQQQRLDAAFAHYTISEYAARFDGFDGERFEVMPTPIPNPNGVVVASRIIKSDGEPVALNYLMRQDGDGTWKVIDVYLDGTISQLATRRSEFVSVLQRDGADGLVELIERRTAALRG